MSQAPAPNSSPLRVLVIGGGLAGMAAAVALESAGAGVTLIEARRTLGGRAGSFEDPQTGEILDNCQHVLLGCCTNLIDFYRRIGAIDLIRFERTVHFRDETGNRFDLYGVEGWPAPIHLAPSMLAFEALTMRQKLAVGRAMLAMMRLGDRGREKLAEQSFGQWLDAHGQPRSLLGKFYDPILVSALNEETRRASASYAIQVFQEAMLRHRDGYLIGLPTCPLAELYQRIPCRDVRLGTRVSELVFSGGRVTGAVLQSGQTLPADAIVVATNHHAVRRWIPAEEAARDGRFWQSEMLQSVPILGAHLWFDRPIMSDSHAALFTGPLQWLFRKDAEGRALHGVISAARQWVDVPKEHCLAMFEAQVRRVFPDSRRARLVRGAIVIEKRATFSPAPGVDRLRPPQAPPPGGIANLFLAGDYTQTHWPATMEGAVRSGYLAAEAAVSSRPIAAGPFLLEKRRKKSTFFRAGGRANNPASA